MNEHGDEDQITYDYNEFQRKQAETEEDEYNRWTD